MITQSAKLNNQMLLRKRVSPYDLIRELLIVSTISTVFLRNDDEGGSP